MADQHLDIVVIGGGIVGLSTAMQLTRRFPRLRLAVLEKEDGVARHQSGHNSGVIHSGIYYTPGSLKAQLCVEGSAAMVAFCRDHGLPCKICGKVIVANTPDEQACLEGLLGRGQANGVAGLKLLTREQLLEIEPHSGGIRALHVPGTGITDYSAVCKKYAEIIVQQGGAISTGTAAVGLDLRSREIHIETTRGVTVTRHAINCAGLQSDQISRMAGLTTDLQIVPFRGEYYDLIPQRHCLVRGLIYPAPDSRFPFLGVHFTNRVHGGVDAGPNAVLAFKREGYRRSDFSLQDAAGTLFFPGFWHLAARHWRYGAGEFHRSFSKQAFVGALQRLLPEIRESDLVPGGSGVRAQALRRDGTLVDDFHFTHANNMLHVCNVPSPAATASIPIGRTIADMAQETFGLQAR